MSGLSVAFRLCKPCIYGPSAQRRSGGAVCSSDAFGPRPHHGDHAARTQRLATQAAATQAEERTTTAMPKPFFEVLPSVSPSHMINNNRGFVEEHRIRGHEAGPDQHSTMSTIANIIQEVASNHAVAMWGRSEQGFAADPELAESGLIFVMTRMQIQMDAYPKWGEVVHVETWFQASGKIGAQRDFLFTCKDTGRRLGRATSSWVMINLHTRRLAKMPDSARQKLFWYAEEAPARQAIDPQYTKVKIPEVQMPAEIVGPQQLARRSDIDMNGHVNNVTYLAWALETVPQDIYDNCHLYQVEIDFKAECHCGDIIESLAQRCTTPEAMASNGAGPCALAFVHTLRRCEGEACAELVRMRTLWRAGERPCCE